MKSKIIQSSNYKFIGIDFRELLMYKFYHLLFITKKALVQNESRLSCTEGGTRTRTLLLALDFESSVSTNSTTSAISNFNPSVKASQI